MATFWTGTALAADYGQHRISWLGTSTRPGGFPSEQEIEARRRAFRALNDAIGKAVQAQLDEPPLVCWLDDADDDDWLMHGWMETPHLHQPLAVFH